MQFYQLCLIGILLATFGVFTEAQLPSVMTQYYCAHFHNSHCNVVYPLEPVYLVTSFVPFDMPCLANSPGSSSGLDLLGADGAAIVMGQTGSLPCNTHLRNIVDRQVHDGHGLGGDAGVRLLLCEAWNHDQKRALKESVRQKSPYILKRQLNFINKWPYIWWRFLGLPVR